MAWKTENVAPLWTVLKGLVPAEPRPQAIAYAWRWRKMRELLLHAGETISAAEAERRVLMLNNPGLDGKPHITDTLYAGLQLILPGEIARAHRHTQAALRFVLEGSGAYTAVNGVRADMHRGDYIVTPPWTWHHHGHDGSEPVMWLDGLDLPIVNFLRAGFREEYESEEFPHSCQANKLWDKYSGTLLPINTEPTSLCSPVFSYPYERSREALERLKKHDECDPHLGVNVRYAHPLTGGWTMPTIAASMRLIPAGWGTRLYRSVEGTVLTVLEGCPTVEIEGQGSFELEPNDVLAVPGWTSWRVQGGVGRDAVFFAFSDRPVFEKLGLYREARA
ncbi:MAG: gentisate 1,2-dioxygenase [Burkholderiales bacterium PBB3]|nr:MAG: gentisate 1,2-dioxygenase [Burkholderiales bacterium PBB3]